MIITRLMGGMGNQMFQYALGKNLAIKYNTILKMDLSFLLDRAPRKDFVFRDYDLDIFNIVENFADKNEILSYDRFAPTKIKKVLSIARKKFLKFPYHLVEEPHFHFTPDVLKSSDNSYLIGYWQSEKYFKDIENVIRKEFTLKKDIEREWGVAAEMAKKITSVNAVCVNVRRGFAETRRENIFHGFCGLDYFNEGAKIVAEKTKNPHFFIFSDNIAWCKENFKWNFPTDFVGHECAGEKFGYYLKLMSLCRHFIIPNSTFAWWGAWLCENKEKIVIAPKKWFNDSSINTQDIIPTGWIRI